MALNLQELKQWPPEIADLAQSARDAATNHTNAADFYRSLMVVSGWEGQGEQAARSAMTGTAGEHDAVAENLGAAANRIGLIHQDAEDLVAEIKSILNDAAMQPAVAIDETTNQVIPPDTNHMTEEYAAQVAAKVTDLQGRIAAVLADGERIDADLAGAITAASGRSEQVVKTATSLQELLLPESNEQQLEDRQPTPSPDNLDGALEQLTQGAGAGRAPVPLDPVKVEQFKALARETMLRDGVPPEVVEQRLDAVVAAAQKPLPAAKPTEREPMPKPGFSDGFADGWFNTEESIKDLVGANGWEELKDSGADMAKGTWQRATNPIDSLKEEVEHLINYPGHYVGEAAGSTAITAPGAMVGGEAALAARAVGGIPDSVIDTPSPTGTNDHSTPLGPATSDHSPPAVWDYSEGYSPDAPAVASSLNDASVNGQPTVELARQLADLSTHHMPSPTGDAGYADRVVLGKWEGMDGGYIGEAHKNGGIYFDTGADTWNAMTHGLAKPQETTLTWQVNEQFLRTQLENGVSRIEYVLGEYSSLEEILLRRQGSFSAMEIEFLTENAAAYGYTRLGNSWVKDK